MFLLVVEFAYIDFSPEVFYFNLLIFIYLY